LANNAFYSPDCAVCEIGLRSFSRFPFSLFRRLIRVRTSHTLSGVIGNNFAEDPDERNEQTFADNFRQAPRTGGALLTGSGL
jgi:hypothetical protein